ncbi:MAG: 16S rRNA (adenine(1518)-N(6)/adenine(1519)-N(6))-dimethyltransferase RsmA [Alphaproteobacteria bacterium]|nr:16S rRNA (adenine(1518)-N(6)/adenine(1519)-N(6))-dimethyltransferase RsmA [Alphaproteobacteria bacterium]
MNAAPGWLDRLPPLRDVIAAYDLRAAKALGQHFLLDLNLTNRIVRAAGDLRGCTVFEIGPGPGGLTRALLAGEAERIIAIERDARCVRALADLVERGEGRLKIIEGDALRTALADLAPAPRAIVANLPYNVGTELLIGWLKQIENFRSMTLMFQAEVASRILAKPGSKDYGRLSVISQFCCDVTRALNIPARAFTPPPKINSSVVHFTPRANRPQDVPLARLEAVTAAAFGQRRKMLRASLKPLGGEALLIKAGIEPSLRAEDLSVEQFVKLAREISAPATGP